MSFKETSFSFSDFKGLGCLEKFFLSEIFLNFDSTYLIELILAANLSLLSMIFQGDKFESVFKNMFSLYFV